MSGQKLSSQNGDLGGLLETWITFLRGQEKSPETRRTFEWTVRQFVSFCEAEGVGPYEINVSHAAQHVQLIKKRPGRKKAQQGDKQCISPWGVYALAKDARTFLNWCYRTNLIPKAVLVPVPRPLKQEHSHLRTKAEREALIWASKQGRLHLRDFAVGLLMLETGLRKFEARSVNWSHIAWHSDRAIGKVVVPKGKGRKERRVPYLVEVGFALQALKSHTEKTFGEEAVADDASVFRDERGNRLGKWGMRMLFKRISARTRFKVAAHMLRHTYGRGLVPHLPALTLGT